MNAVILHERPYIIPKSSGIQTTNCGRQDKLGQAMWRLIKALLFLIILGALALIAYAYVGPIFFPSDFAPPTEEVTRPVTIETE